jgi:hypothetical protein
MPENRWLIAGGVLSAAAAALHIAVIFGGPAWYRFFGAGEAMARAAEKGSSTPAVIVLLIAVVLLVWAAYAFSGAGLIGKLPLLRTGLITISAIYLLRGFALIPTLLLKPEIVDSFTFWSSLVVLFYGLSYAIGTWSAWPRLSGRGQERQIAG